MKQARLYLKSFLFGTRIVSLFLLLLAPIGLWLFLCIGLIPKLHEVRFLRVPSATVVGVWEDQAAAQNAFARREGRAIYEVADKDAKPQFIVVTRSLRPSERGSLDEYLESRPFFYEADLSQFTDEELEEVAFSKKIDFRPDFPQVTIVPERWNVLGAFLSIALQVLSIIVCLALYFPLTRAIRDTLRGGSVSRNIEKR